MPSWHLYAAQTLNMRAPSPKWTVKKLTRKPLHVGDVCMLGIFCTAFEPAGANRDLLDFIDVAIDPRAGRTSPTPTTPTASASASRTRRPGRT